MIAEAVELPLVHVSRRAASEPDHLSRFLRRDHVYVPASSGRGRVEREMLLRIAIQLDGLTPSYGIGILDERHHVAHAENALEQLLGWKRSKSPSFSARRGVQNRLAGDPLTTAPRRRASRRRLLRADAVEAGLAVSANCSATLTASWRHGVDAEKHVVGPSSASDLGRSAIRCSRGRRPLVSTRGSRRRSLSP